jgi:GNAT superfamily N-acetyltransferase
VSVLEKHVTIRLLRPSDMEGAIGLTRAAGWNQVSSDWQRLLSLEPEGCFALECDGRLAASTTVLCYGRDLAWVGMVLTFPEFRRRGFAQSLIERALQFAEARNIGIVKLDATDDGIGLYRKYGFVEECEIQRWRRERAAAAGQGEALFYKADPGYDRMHFGADRAELLAALAPLGAATLPGQGYAMGRPGFLAAYFGPCVAESVDAARTLLQWFLSRHPGEPVFWDLFPANKDAVELAEEFGFTLARRLTRMSYSRSGSQISNSNKVFAIASFELG